VPRLTALRRAGPGRVALEVDGRSWRAVPDDVVVRARLAAGVELDRPTLRRIREELVRARAVRVAARAVSRRDVSVRELADRLARAGAPPSAAADVVVSLERAGVLDDVRLARSQASSLAERGYGDAAILVRLEGTGVAEGLAREAVADLPTESDRARRVVAAERDRAKAVRLLVRRGFSAETVDDVLGPLDSEGSPELG
jgi:regulatory protein